MQIRILQVGLGIRGSQWAEIIQDYPDAETVGFVDVDESRLSRVRTQFGTSENWLFTSLAEACQKVEADAVLIATPSRDHAEHAIEALQAGLAVLVEKPLATSVADATEVIDVSRVTGKPVVVGDNYRYWPAERTVRKLIADGVIGRLDTAALVDRRRMPSGTEGPWLAEIEYPQLQEIAIHHFDSLRYMVGGNPLAISTRAWNPPWSDYRHGANTEAQIEFEELKVGYLGTMWSHRFSFSLWIEGETGSIWTNRKYVFWRPHESRLFRPVKRVEVPAGDEKRYPRGGTTSLLNSLRDAVAGIAEPETSSQDSLWNVAMVEAGRLSDRERRTVDIDEVLAGTR